MKHFFKGTYLYLLIISFIVFTKTSTAQNLIPNPSFEEFKNTDKVGEAYNHRQILHGVNEWDKVKQTPDFWVFTTNDSLTKNFNYHYGLGFQKPHSGKAFVFINLTEDNAECIDVQLSEPLIANHLYKIQVFVSKSESSAYKYLKTIPVMLTYKKYDRSETFKDIPVLELEPDSGEYALIDTIGWHKCTKIYRARGGESRLMLGTYRRSYYNGKTFEEPNKKAHLKNYRYAIGDLSPGYVFDDVSLIEVDSLGNAIDHDTTITSNQIIDFRHIKADSAYRLNNVLFEFGKSELLPTSYGELDELAGYLKQHVLFIVEISGHTDNTGSEKGNQKLSEERAISVSNYLVSMGVQTQRIIYKGYGSTKPLTDNSSEEDKAKNRRVEFKVRQK